MAFSVFMWLTIELAVKEIILIVLISLIKREKNQLNILYKFEMVVCVCVFVCWNSYWPGEGNVLSKNTLWNLIDSAVCKCQGKFIKVLYRFHK